MNYAILQQTKICIFLQVGFCDEFSSTLASVGLGFMKVLSTGVSLAVVDGLGRRKALLGGITLMALSVLSLSVFAFYQVLHSNEITFNSLDHKSGNGGRGGQECPTYVPRATYGPFKFGPQYQNLGAFCLFEKYQQPWNW